MNEYVTAYQILIKASEIAKVVEGFQNNENCQDGIYNYKSRNKKKKEYLCNPFFWVNFELLYLKALQNYQIYNVKICFRLVQSILTFYI